MIPFLTVTYYDDGLVEGVDVNVGLVLFVIVAVAMAARLVIGA